METIAEGTQQKCRDLAWQEGVPPLSGTPAEWNRYSEASGERGEADQQHNPRRPHQNKRRDRIKSNSTASDQDWPRSGKAAAENTPWPNGAKRTLPLDISTSRKRPMSCPNMNMFSNRPYLQVSIF